MSDNSEKVIIYLNLMGSGEINLREEENKLKEEI
jgi:hypothetical protein